jgi:Na+/glutamate symporter
MFEAMNERVKKLTVNDIGLIKLSVFFATIFIIHMFPQLLNISYPVLIILAIALAAKPIYAMWFKK